MTEYHVHDHYLHDTEPVRRPSGCLTFIGAVIIMVAAVWLLSASALLAYSLVAAGVGYLTRRIFNWTTVAATVAGIAAFILLLIGR